MSVTGWLRKRHAKGSPQGRGGKFAADRRPIVDAQLDYSENFYPQAAQVEALAEQIARLDRRQIAALRKMGGPSGRMYANDRKAYMHAGELVEDRVAFNRKLRELEAAAAGNPRLYGGACRAVDAEIVYAYTALRLRHMIGVWSPRSDRAFTQEEYDVLSAPWRMIVGPIHRDDPPASTSMWMAAER